MSTPTHQNTSTLAAVLARASESINESRTFVETLDAVVHATRTSLPEFAHVSVSMKGRNGSFQTAAGTDHLAFALDAVQYDLGEGPCVEAVDHEPVVVVRMRHEQRWPGYVAEALARGVRSQVAVRLFTGHQHVAGLNLYSTEHDEVDDTAAQTARLFATHAAIIVGRAQREEQLSDALATRTLIGQAIGILMERYRIDADRAFQFLVRASSSSNIKVRDVADEIVASSTESYGTGG